MLNRTVSSVALSLLTLVSHAPAAEISAQGGYTIVAQDADDDRIEADGTVSADLRVITKWNPGSLHLYIEGNSTPRQGGVALLLPESNADAGTALDGDGQGRVQVSELKYELILGHKRFLTFGLLDLTTYLDTTRINNDENMQFLGTSFLNNPTIEFPDYVVGGIFQQESRGFRRPAVEVAITSSSGLADNPNRTYDELFEVSDRGKGIFIASEAGWETRHGLYRAGVWLDTSSHVALDSRREDARNYGAYSSLGRSFGDHAANLRLGLSRETVSQAARFVSATYQHTCGKRVFGIGAARIWESDELPGPSDDTLHAEAYLRIDLADGLYLTPSIQYIKNSAFNGSREISSVRSRVIGVRLRHRF